MEQKNKNPNVLLLVGVFILALTTLGVILMLKNTFQGKLADSKTLRSAPTQMDTTAQYAPFSFGEVSTVRISQQSMVPILLQSYKRDVTGFDLIIQYDPTALRFTGFAPMQMTYDVFPLEKDGMVTITAVKKISTTGTAVFDTIKVGDFKFTPLRKGTTKITIISNNGKAKTQVVDAQSQKMLQDASKSVTINVE